MSNGPRLPIPALTPTLTLTHISSEMGKYFLRQTSDLILKKPSQVQIRYDLPYKSLGRLNIISELRRREYKL